MLMYVYDYVGMGSGPQKLICFALPSPSGTKIPSNQSRYHLLPFQIERLEQMGEFAVKIMLNCAETDKNCAHFSNSAETAVRNPHLVEPKSRGGY